MHSLAPEHRKLIAAALALVVAALLVVRELGGGGGRPAVPPLRVAGPAHAARAARLVVDVAGAVRRPGVYRLPRGARIADALARAGGTTPRAEVTLVDLAAPLADGEQVLVPARGAASPAGAGGAGGAPGAPVDLNTASAEQLDTLPGIGPATAAKIVAFRQAHGPFSSLDELDAIPGIGPARIEQLRGLAIP